MSHGDGVLVWPVMLPVIGLLFSLALGGRWAGRIVLIVLPIGVFVAGAIMARVWHAGHPLSYAVGGWPPPLGIALRADGISAIMLVVTGVIVGAVALFARPTFGPEDSRAEFTFWTLLLGVWAALGIIWLGGDLFTLYVALELLTFAAVPLVCLDGRAETMVAALRYLMFALVGSVLYLLGVVLFYGRYGTLDIVLLARLTGPEPAVWIAAALMIAGLAAKTALFPLHLWLPPAHAGAPAAASALLSALVVKGSFFLIVRLWFDVLPGVPSLAAAQILGALGAAAILVGSVMALRQARLKLMIAYSTMAQIGYLFFLFPLATGAAAAGLSGIAWTGGMLQLVAHAVAKAAMFMAAGLIGEALGHDRIERFAGIGRALPMTVAAFAIAGMSLMGLPPSGGFVAKLLLLTAAVGDGQWLWAAVILIGGLLAGGYVFRILAPALATPVEPLVLRGRISRQREAVALGLALGALLLGLVPLRQSALIEIGRPAPFAQAVQ